MNPRRWIAFRTPRKSAGIEDTPEEFAAEILEKARHRTDAEMALAISRGSTVTVDWLVDAYGAPLEPPYLAVKVTGALFHTQGGPGCRHQGASPAQGHPTGVAESVCRGRGGARPERTVLLGLHLRRGPDDRDDAGARRRRRRGCPRLVIRKRPATAFHDWYTDSVIVHQRRDALYERMDASG